MRYFYFMLIFLTISCETDNGEIKEEIHANPFKSKKIIKKDSLYTEIYWLNENSYRDGPAYLFYDNGLIYRKENYSDGFLSGYVYIYDKEGRLSRKALWGLREMTENALVENIEYDSLGKIIEKESFYLGVLPDSNFDTINVLNKEELDLTLSFHYPKMIFADIIVEYNGNSDTLKKVNGDRDFKYKLKRVKEGGTRVNFLLHVYYEENRYGIYESFRVINNL